MNKFHFYPLVLFGMLLLQSCADKIVSECNDTTAPSGLRSRLSSIQQYIYTPTCALSGCHGGTNPQHELDLSNTVNSYANLVNVTSHENDALKRVDPGNSAQSWLIKKVNGDGTSAMPPTGMLSAATIDTIAAWIDAGALNN